jgi:hypothetical protein
MSDTVLTTVVKNNQAFGVVPNKHRRSFHMVPRAGDEINQVGCYTAQEADYEQYPTKPQHLPCPPLRGFLYEAKAARNTYKTLFGEGI